jgi:hypothetical protein
MATATTTRRKLSKYGRPIQSRDITNRGERENWKCWFTYLPPEHIPAGVYISDGSPVPRPVCFIPADGLSKLESLVRQVLKGTAYLTTVCELHYLGVDDLPDWLSTAMLLRADDVLLNKRECRFVGGQYCMSPAGHCEGFRRILHGDWRFYVEMSKRNAAARPKTLSWLSSAQNGKQAAR